MPFSDFLKLTDDKLHEVFSRKQNDPAKARNAMAARLDKAHDQFHATEPARGRKMFKINNSVVELTLPFSVAGKNVFHIPSERFADALKSLKESVTKGELDKEIEAGAEQSVGGEAASTRRKRAPMSEEAKAAMAAKRKATMAKNGTKPGGRKKAE